MGEEFSDEPSLRESPKVLTEADLDDMHHALGRPDGPWVTPYRNYFATGTDSSAAARFRELDLWSEGRVSPGGMTYFHVTPEGVAEVWKWRARANAAKGQRAYEVAGRDITAQVILAKSRSAARYALYLQSDWFAGGFAEFLARFQPTARLVSARKDGSSPQNTEAQS